MAGTISSITALKASQVNTAAQVSVLKTALENEQQMASQLLSTISPAGVGGNIDISA